MVKITRIFSFTIPDFVEMQRNSFSDFLQRGLVRELSKRNPIKNIKNDIEIVLYPEFYQFSPPEYTLKNAIIKAKSYSCRLYVPVQLTNKITKQTNLQWVLFCNLPLMTKRGHFIINGSPRVIINQMVRSPGIYFQETIDQKKQKSLYADIISYRGAWLRIESDKKSKIWLRMKKTPKVSIVIFLQALGYKKESIFQSIYQSLVLNVSLLESNYPLSKNQALRILYSTTHSKKDTSEITADMGKKFLFRKFMNPRTYDLGFLGRERLNKKLGVSVPLSQCTLTPQDFLFATDYLIKLKCGIGRIDDIDHLKNRRVRASGELIQSQFATGLLRLEKLIREKLKKQKKTITIQNLITTKPINGALREFFGSSQLSQFMDQTNPLAEITHKRRITSLGPGGISRETAGMAIRGIHSSHYGRICPIETPEGQNAGLVNSMTTFGRVSSTGLLETPFLKVYKGNVQKNLLPVFLSAEQEQEVIIGPGDLKITKYGWLGKNFIPIRCTDEFKRVLRNQVEYIAISPIQMISIATSLIPFLEHDDANRALMGSNMQRQAVPLLVRERPIVGTGLEARVVSDSGHSIESKTSGFIKYVSSNKIIVQTKLGEFSKVKANNESFQNSIETSNESFSKIEAMTSKFFNENFLNAFIFITNVNSFKQNYKTMFVSKYFLKLSGKKSLNTLRSNSINKIENFKGLKKSFISTIVRNYLILTVTNGYLYLNKFAKISFSNYEEKFTTNNTQPNSRNGTSSKRSHHAKRSFDNRRYSNSINNLHQNKEKKYIVIKNRNKRLFEFHFFLANFQKRKIKKNSIQSLSFLPENKQLYSRPLYHEKEKRNVFFTILISKIKKDYCYKKVTKNTAIYFNQLFSNHSFVQKHLLFLFFETIEDRLRSQIILNSLQNKGIEDTRRGIKDTGRGNIKTSLISLLAGNWENLLLQSFDNKTKKNHYLSSHQSSLEYLLQKYQRSNQNTCISHTPIVKEGDWIEKGELLADGTASFQGELSLGKNIIIAYMPWEGYNFEDAILINERLVYDDIYTSLHIERYEIEIRETKFGIEQITNKIPEIEFCEINHLDSNGIVKIGSFVKEGDILVGKITPIRKKSLSPYEKLLYDIVGKEIPTTRDTSLRVPKGVHGRVIDVHILDTETIPSEIVFEGPGRVHVYIAEKRKIQVGDKMAGRHGNKGIVSRILPREDMPYMPDGTPIDMVLNPLGVPSRMNVGQVFECLLGFAGNHLKEHYKIPPFDEMFGCEASRSIVYSKLYEASIKTQKQWIFNANIPGKIILFDGRTGENFHQPITVGIAYILKLVHLVDEKIHARSTGPYSLVTQQPLRGRSKHGGQRLGEMEVWALEGYGAAYILQELLTVKSDDMKGRYQVMDAILNDEPLSLGMPESFKVLIRELQSLCLDVGIYHINSVGRRTQIDVGKVI